MPDTTEEGILIRLSKASSAEDFFALLNIAYDPAVVRVARLHILRRMGQYLAAEDFSGASDDAIAERCGAVLQRAYGDFVKSSPLDQRVFKVLQDAVAAPKAPTPTLVQLGSLK